MNEIVATNGTREFVGLVVGLLIAFYAIYEHRSRTSYTRFFALLFAAPLFAFLIAYGSDVTKMGMTSLGFSIEREIKEARELIDGVARATVAKIEQEVRIQKEDIQKQQGALDEQREKISSMIEQANKLGSSLAWEDISNNTSPFDAQNFEYSFVESDKSKRYFFATYIHPDTISAVWSSNNNIVVNYKDKKRAIVDQTHSVDVITFRRQRSWSKS